MITLYATRPEYSERRIRNDRITNVSTARAVQLAMKEMAGWQMIEPLTKFELVFTEAHEEEYQKRIDLARNMR